MRKASGSKLRKPTSQTLITIGALALAVCAMALASIYSGDQSNGPAINANAAGTGPTGDGLTPVEGWFPRTGQGGACSEAIGVDLIDGYAATLSINGTPIPVTDMNTYVPLEEDSEASEAATQATVLSAGGSLGHFTWGPEVGCPGGEILRPQDNLVVACVYEVGDNSANCLPYRYTFDVL